MYLFELVPMSLERQMPDWQIYAPDYGQALSVCIMEFVTFVTILPPSPVILWTGLGGKPNSSDCWIPWRHALGPGIEHSSWLSLKGSVTAHPISKWPTLISSRLLFRVHLEICRIVIGDRLPRSMSLILEWKWKSMYKENSVSRYRHASHVLFGSCTNRSQIWQRMRRIEALFWLSGTRTTAFDFRRSVLLW